MYNHWNPGYHLGQRETSRKCNQWWRNKKFGRRKCNIQKVWFARRKSPDPQNIPKTNLQEGLQKFLPHYEDDHFWLNNIILQDEDFLENVSELYQKLKSKIDTYDDIVSWWDILAKPAFKQFCMDVSERLAYVRKNTKSFLFCTKKT